MLHRHSLQPRLAGGAARSPTPRPRVCARRPRSASIDGVAAVEDHSGSSSKPAGARRGPPSPSRRSHRAAGRRRRSRAASGRSFAASAICAPRAGRLPARLQQRARAPARRASRAGRRRPNAEMAVASRIHSLSWASAAAVLKSLASASKKRARSCRDAPSRRDRGRPGPSQPPTSLADPLDVRARLLERVLEKASGWR